MNDCRFIVRGIALSLSISVLFAQNPSMTSKVDSKGIKSILQCSDERSSINGTCKTTDDCIGGLDCVEGYCKCRRGTIETTRNLGPFGRQPYCQLAPGFRSPCTSKCQEPLVCAADRQRQTNAQKICQCPEGLSWEFGACFKSCPDGEFYSTSSAECRKNCEKTEIKINDKCVKESQLSEPCTSSAQCRPAFSQCSLGACTCLSGFTSSNNRCITQDTSCPFGETPLNKEAGTPIKCTKTASETEFQISAIAVPSDLIPTKPKTAEEIRKIDDSCPEEFYCETYSGSQSLPQSGHCCRRSQLKCPIGTAFPNSTLDDVSSCPSETHYWFSVPKSESDIRSRQLCCPKPCRGSDIYLEGRCYAPVGLGEICETSEQCSNHKGKCVEGICNCVEESEAKTRGLHKYCEVTCKSSEFRYYRTCIPRRKLGEECSGNFMCPSGSRCRQGVCKCRCGMQALNPTFCAEPPSCPSIQSSLLQPVSRQPSQHTPKIPISPESLVYCRTDSKPLEIVPDGNKTVVEQCAAGEFCNRIALNLGACCSVPNPTCPENVEPESVDSCDLRDRTSCGAGQFCHLFFFTSSPSSGTVCCPLSSNENKTPNFLASILRSSSPPIFTTKPNNAKRKSLPGN